MKYPILFLIACCCLFSCGGKEQTNPVVNNNPASGTPKTPENQVWLEGVYATSIAEGSAVAHLFDQNINTAWQTRAGTGPDEGVMLYFAQPLVAKTLELVPIDGLPSGIEVIVYANGQEMSSVLRPNTPFNLPTEKPLRSLYFRIAYTDASSEVEISNGDGEKIKLHPFPASASVGFKELRLLGQDGNPVQLAAPRVVQGTVPSSSTLGPVSAYSTANLFDARHEFVWVEGNQLNAGEGESLRFQLAEPVKITGLRIWNGYQRSAEHYSANARVRDFEFGADNGSMRSYTLGDYAAGQKIELSPTAEGNNFTFTIKSIYPGKRYKDLAISDIVFYEGERPFIIQTALPAQYRRELSSTASSSPWSAVLDRRISNANRYEAWSESKSLLLRSDGTFVMYNDTNLEDTQEKTIADGNWTFTPDGKNIKVFGKLFDQRAASVYYQGTGQTEVTRIFNDVLKIDGRSVSGSKYIGTFWWK